MIKCSVHIWWKPNDWCTFILNLRLKLPLLVVVIGWWYKCIFPNFQRSCSFIYIFNTGFFAAAVVLSFFFAGEAMQPISAPVWKTRRWEEKSSRRTLQEFFIFFFPCLICCKAAAAAGEVAAHPASGDRRNSVLTLAAGNAFKEGNASTEQLLGQSADYTGPTVKTLIHA